MKKLLEKATDWAARLAGARTAVQELHDTDRELREAHRAAEQAVTHVTSAPAPREELLANMERLVDELAAQSVTDRGPGLLGLGPGFELSRDDGALVPRPPRLPDWLTFEKLTGRDLVGLCRPAVKAALRECIASLEYTPGPPTAERAERLAEAQARCAAIEQQHTELVDAAAALTPPIVLELLPAVKARRDAEAAQRQREARADQDRQAREAGINRQHDVSRGGTPSPYLAANQARRAAP